MKTDFHPDEWTARLQLAACYRIFAMLGWTEMIYNHITLDRKSTRLNSSHVKRSRMPSSA